MVTENTTGLTDTGPAAQQVDEKETDAGQQQPATAPSPDTAQAEQSEKDNSAVVDAERYSAAQRKISEMGDELKVLKAQLDVYRNIQSTKQEAKQEEFDEDKFIDELVGGEKTLEMLRNDPGAGSRELVKRIVRHNAAVYQRQQESVQEQLQKLQEQLALSSSETSDLKDELSELGQNDAFNSLPTQARIDIARRFKAARSAKVQKPPPAMTARRSNEPRKQSMFPPGYLDMVLGDNKQSGGLI